MTHLMTALTNVRRSPYQALASVLMLSLTFFVGYAFSLFVLGSEQILRYFESQPQVIAFFQLKTDPAEIEKLATQLRQQPYVESVNVVSSQQALEFYRQANQDDPLLLELVTAESLPASIEVSGPEVADLVKIKNQLDGVEIIDELVFQEDLINDLTRWTSSLRLAGMAAILIMAITSLLIMVIIIGMKVVSKRAAIQIMRIIGATKWYIQAPFVFEGIIYGLIGSAIGWLTMYGSLLYLTPWLKTFLGQVNIFPIHPALFAVQFGVGGLVAIFLGALAGGLAVARIIRNR